MSLRKKDDWDEALEELRTNLDDKEKPQWFVCLNDQDGDNSVLLSKFDNPSLAHKARIYKTFRK